MSPLAGLLTDRVMMIAVTLMSSVFINAVILLDTVYLSKRKVQLSRFLGASLLISVATLVPGYSFAAIRGVPQDVALLVRCALMYASPLYLPLYYWVYRTIIGVPRDMSLVFMESVLLAQFIATLTYQAMKAFWAGVLPANAWIGPNLPAMICTSLAAWAAWHMLKASVNKTGKFLLIPHDYPLEHIRSGLPSLFLTCAVNYLMLVFVTVALHVRREAGVQYEEAWVYVLMMGIEVFHIIDRYHDTRIRVLEWHAKATALYTDSMMRAFDELRKLHHDFSNVLQVYGGYIAARDLDGLASYHGGISQNMLAMINNLSLIEALRPRAAVYNLLAIKIELMRQLGIRFEPMGVGVLNDVPFNDLDLCHILEGMIDFAIRASGESAEKRIMLTCRPITLPGILMTLAYTTADDEGAPGSDEDALSTVRSILYSSDYGDLSVDRAEGWCTISAMLRLTK